MLGVGAASGIVALAGAWAEVEVSPAAQVDAELLAPPQLATSVAHVRVSATRIGGLGFRAANHAEYTPSHAIDRALVRSGHCRLGSPRQLPRERVAATDSARTYARAAASMMSGETLCPAPVKPSTSSTIETSPRAS